MKTNIVEMFSCQECGAKNGIIESIQAVIDTPIAYFAIDKDNVSDTEMGNAETYFGDTICFKCATCEAPIKNKNGNITNYEDLAAWILDLEKPEGE